MFNNNDDEIVNEINIDELYEKKNHMIFLVLITLIKF